MYTIWQLVLCIISVSSDLLCSLHDNYLADIHCSILPIKPSSNLQEKYANAKESYFLQETAVTEWSDPQAVFVFVFPVKITLLSDPQAVFVFLFPV